MTSTAGEQDCAPILISSVDLSHESDCGAADGAITLYFVDDNPGNSTYSVWLDYGDKGKEYYGLNASDGSLVIPNLRGGTYNNIVIERESNACRSQVYDRPHMLNHGCEFDDRTGCFGTQWNYTNCDGENFNINLNYVSANTYIFVDDDYLGCIAYVDENCTVGPSQRVWCADLTKTEPTPNQGYQYGSVHFNRVVGTSSLGISELASERINWVLCNQSGHSQNTINQAIWYFTGTYNTCNGLCSSASNAVTSVQGGIADQMVWYEPLTPGIQPFFEDKCYCSLDLVCESNISGAGWQIEDDCEVEVCEGESLTLSVNPNDLSSYEWSGPNGFSFSSSSSSDALISNNISNSHEGTYSVTVTDSDGCEGTTSIEVVVKKAAWESVVLGQDVSCTGVCDGSLIIDANYSQTGTFNAKITFEGQVLNFGPYDTGAPITLNNLCPGTYSNITIEGVNTGCTAVWPGNITISEGSAISVDAGEDQTICGGDVSLTASYSDEAQCSGVCTKYAVSVYETTGNVSSASNALGASDGNGALLDEGDSGPYTRIILDMGEVIPAGTQVCARVKKHNCNNTTSKVSKLKFWIPPTINPPFSSFVEESSVITFNNTSYEEICFTTTDDCRYIKITDEDGCSFKLDNLRWTDNDCASSSDVTYSWSNGETTQTINVNPSVTTTYSVTVTDCNGCSAADDVTVFVDGCEDPFNTSFFNDCDSDLTIDAYISGLDGSADNCVSVPNSGNMTRVIAEVWVEDGECSNSTLPSFLTFTAGGVSKSVTGVTATQSSPGGNEEKIYRVEFVGSVSEVCVTNTNSCNLTSMALYVERPSTDASSSFTAVNYELHDDNTPSGQDDCLTRTLQVGSSDLPRDLVVKIPIHEKDNTRAVEVTVDIQNGSGTVVSNTQSFTDTKRRFNGGIVRNDLPGCSR